LPAFTPGVARRWEQQGQVLTLTPRQAEILALASKGLTDKEIARRLGISPCTVRSHLHHVYQYNGLPNRTAAVRYLLERVWHKHLVASRDEVQS